jgi:hypothetical protein
VVVRRHVPHGQGAKDCRGGGHERAEDQQLERDLAADADPLRQRETRRSRLEISSNERSAEEDSGQHGQHREPCEPGQHPGVGAHLVQQHGMAQRQARGQAVVLQVLGVGEVSLDARHDERDRCDRENGEQARDGETVLPERSPDEVLPPRPRRPSGPGGRRGGCHRSSVHDAPRRMSRTVAPMRSADRTASQPNSMPPNRKNLLPGW